jgi:hypothetical protein
MGRFKLQGFVKYGLTHGLLHNAFIQAREGDYFSHWATFAHTGAVVAYRAAKAAPMAIVASVSIMALGSFGCS